MAAKQGEEGDGRNTPSVLCVGIAVFDEIFALKEIPKRATKIYASDFACSVGGPAANAALTVARQGGRATLWARIGADLQGDRIIDDLVRSGVDVGRVRRCADTRSGISSVGVTPDGERVIFVFTDPNLDADASWLPLDEVGRHHAVLADLRWPDAAERVLLRARALGLPSVLDADVTPDPAALARLAPLASHVVFSAPALELLAGPGDEIRRLAAIRDAGGQQLVAVTLGDGGVTWVDADGAHHEPALRIVAIDTLAAGDVFHGAFALALARCLPAHDAMRFASLVAGVKCTRWGGGASIPTAQDVDDFVRSQPGAE